ncbi:aldehyde dehydrogenase family protein [Klebsiella variicola subsp. variicola]|nr:aldehyde dehydrogenase family protein [Klebsiella variicola subsp. variicola]
MPASSSFRPSAWPVYRRRSLRRAERNRLTVWDPATGQAIATTADASPADVDRAVMSRLARFVDRRWAGRTPADRERILLRFADLVEQHGEEAGATGNPRAGQIHCDLPRL